MTRPQAATRLTILGSGTSTGVPLIHCGCAVCRSRRPRNHRLRASAWVQTRGKSLLIDTSPDLRQQAMRAKIRKIDAVLYTHPHADHLHGIDELRSFNYVQRAAIPVYGNAWTTGDLINRFSYVFKPGLPEGGGVPTLIPHTFDARAESLDIQGVPVVPIALSHGPKESVGYRIDDIAYVVDCSYIGPSSLERLRGLSALVLDCVRLEPHGTHFNLEKALRTVSEVRPDKTYLTHLGHDFDYGKWVKKLPKGVTLAYDGLQITS